MKTRIILIGGVPGTGKTTIGMQVSQEIGTDLFLSTDTIREIMRSYHNEEECPLLFSVTHQCWKFFGEKKKENIIRGMKEHSKLLFPLIEHLISSAKRSGRSIVIEGVHIIPEIKEYLQMKGHNETEVYILSLRNKLEHVKRFDLKNEKRENFHGEWYTNYPVIKILSDWLDTTSTTVIDNKIMKKTVKIIVMQK